jgi:DNA-binding GntR family transcriptional regulator
VSNPPGPAALVPDQPDRAYVEIRRAIVEGRYGPGERLVEQRIAADLEVSRTPVREALRRLEAEGLVVVSRNRGAEVRRLDATDVADLYDLRARLEAYAAELAAERATPDDVSAIRRAVDDFDAAVRAVGRRGPDLAQVRALEEANAAFHGAVLDASHHTRIHQLVGRAVDLPLVFRALHHFGSDELARSSLFHRLVHDAIAAGEPTRAGRLMTEHILQGRDAILAQLDHPDLVSLLAAGDP